jgi:hypothetical protein
MVCFLFKRRINGLSSWLDGERFLVLKPFNQSAPSTIVVVQNWFEELKRRVPPTK